MKKTNSNLFLPSADFKTHLHPSVFQQPGWFWELFSVLTIIISIWCDISETIYVIKKYKQSLEKEPRTPHFPSGDTDFSCTHYFYLSIYTNILNFQLIFKFPCNVLQVGEMSILSQNNQWSGFEDNTVKFAGSSPPQEKRKLNMDLSHLQFVNSNISANLTQTLNCSALAKGISYHDQLLLGCLWSWSITGGRVLHL